MKGKTFLGIIATAIICVVLGHIMITQKGKSNKKFQEALERYENSSNIQSDSIARQQMMDDVEKLKEKYEQSIFPTKGEIDSVNAKLPIMVSEGTLNTKIEYNERTKVQTFYYRFTQEVDESMVTNEVISQLKTQMVSVLRNDQNNVRRLNAGMTFLYVYNSVDGRRLYEIEINSNDINQ